jgi:hypothetical protein
LNLLINREDISNGVLDNVNFLVHRDDYFDASNIPLALSTLRLQVKHSKC